MPNVVCSRWSCIEWSTVSKAADKSNSINAAESRGPQPVVCRKVLAGWWFQLNGLVERDDGMMLGHQQSSLHQQRTGHIGKVRQLWEL